MSFLSIDCSTDVGSLFVKTKNKTFIKNLQSDKSNNDLLMKQIIDFFAENNLKFENISKIFANQGPGNFSGLRGSLAVAKGLSLAKNLDLFGYNTFLWSCSKFNNNKYVYSLIKFRSKYYVKKFDKTLKNISNIKEVTEIDILKNYKDKFKIVPKNISISFDKRILNLKNLKIVNLDHNDLESLQKKGLLDERFIKPFYLS